MIRSLFWSREDKPKKPQTKTHQYIDDCLEFLVLQETLRIDFIEGFREALTSKQEMIVRDGNV